MSFSERAKYTAPVSPTAEPRVCYKCSETKPLDRFIKDARKLGGYRTYCKDCNAARGRAATAKWRASNVELARKLNREGQRRYRKDDPERYREYDKCRLNKPERLARNREYTKRPEVRAVMRDSQRRWREANAERLAPLVRVQVREWRETHRERYNERMREYRRAKPELNRATAQRRRARKQNAEGAFTSTEWRTLCERYGRRCLACKRPGSECNLTVDHVIPLSKGGNNRIENIQPLCGPCNATKGTKTTDYRVDYVFSASEI